MDWKAILRKTLKGAFSGIVAIAGGLFAAGMPMDRHSVVMTAGAIGSAAIHGGLEAFKQSIEVNP